MSMMLLSCRMYLFRLLSTLCQQTSLNNLRTELYYFGSLLKIPGVFVVVASQSSSLRNILNSFFPHQPGSLHKLCKAFYLFLAIYTLNRKLHQMPSCLPGYSFCCYCSFKTTSETSFLSRCLVVLNLKVDLKPISLLFL